MLIFGHQGRLPEPCQQLSEPQRPRLRIETGALAGRHRAKDFRPTRLTSAHAWAEEAGAIFVEAGLWLRAQYFPRPGERDWLASVTLPSTLAIWPVSSANGP